MSEESFGQRARRFVRWGRFMGGCFSLLVIPRLVTGGNRPIAGYDLTPLQIVGLYLVSGLLGGLIIALLYPFKQWFLGAFCVGMLRALPAYLGAALLMRGNDPWSARGGRLKRKQSFLSAVATGCGL